MSQTPSPCSTVREAAPAVARLAARHASDADQDLRLATEVIQAVLDAGFARHFVPVEHGGCAGTFAELSPAIALIGAHCPATSWCAALAASLPRMAAWLPAQGREAIWKSGPDTLIVGAVSPKGLARVADSGWTISGTWQYVSAIEHSQWALVLGRVQADGDPEMRFFALPRADYHIECTWSNIGMRGTGSDTLIIDEAFVPAELSFPASDLLAGRSVGGPAACHAVPLAAVNGLTFCLPMLGAATGALGHWSALAADRLGAPPANPDQARYAETLARSAGEIDAAELLLNRVAAVADKGTAITAAETGRNQRDCALAADMLVTTVDRLFRAAGTAGHSTKSPLQRLWRDIHAASGHIVLQFGAAATAYARTAVSARG